MYGVEFARKRLHDIEQDSEYWKIDHDNAMACLAFEDSLRSCVNLFEMCVRVSDNLWELMLRSTITPEEADSQSRELFEAWRNLGVVIEKKLLEFEAHGYPVEYSSEFRHRYEEVKWMLSPSSEALRDSSIVKARDEAIDALRRGEICDGDVRHVETSEDDNSS